MRQCATLPACCRQVRLIRCHGLCRRMRIVDIRNLTTVPVFTTQDGSEIRELLAHRNSAIRNQSLAEARLPPGGSTMPHYHPRSEEIYYLVEGTGRVQVESDMQEVGPGDAIAIPPGDR